MPATKTQARFAKAADGFELLIPEYKGVAMGIGTRDELDALIAEGVLPAGTVLRAAMPSDF